MKHIVGFSGGIDSQACARWVLNRFPAEDVILINTNAGRHESPVTTQFVQEYNDRIFPVTVVVPEMQDLWKTPGFAETKGLDSHAELTFVGLAQHKQRFPSRKAQFCTEYLKLRPMRRWTQENVTDEFCRYTGVRRDESQKRRDRAFSEWDDFFDCTVYHPIADWTKQMCFDYIRAFDEPINPLYSLGFTRVGCAPCVNASKADIRAWADRSPDMIERVRAYEKEVGHTFYAPIVPGLRINWIDEVVTWSRTDRGGRQLNILNSLERPACESRFGLCE